jgi:hypothetical protein
MTVEQARDLLRAELLVAAAAVVPGLDGVVTDDEGPVYLAAVSGRSDSRFCRVTVETGDPGATDDGARYVEAARETLRDRGWEVGEVAFEQGHHLVVAIRDGFDLAVHAWDGEWRVTLTGTTPAYS